MEKIIIEKPNNEIIEEMGIRSWPIWEKGVSEFDWHYVQKEICYILEGKATVTPEGGEPVSFEKGNLVTFPRGMNCVWSISSPIRKHYRME